VIFDEAHQLPETATLFFARSVHGTTHRTRAGYSRRSALRREGHARSAAVTAALDKAARDLRLALPAKPPASPRHRSGEARIFGRAHRLDSALRSVCAALDALSERSEGLARCSSALGTRKPCSNAGATKPRRSGALGRGVQSLASSECHAASIAGIFHRQLDGHPRGWIFYLRDARGRGDFSHYRGEMGLDDARTACWDSPFDYAAQALLYVPKSSRIRTVTSIRARSSQPRCP